LTWWKVTHDGSQTAKETGRYVPPLGSDEIEESITCTSQPALEIRVGPLAVSKIFDGFDYWGLRKSVHHARKIRVKPTHPAFGKLVKPLMGSVCRIDAPRHRFDNLLDQAVVLSPLVIP
jgi:hypothetical protein